MTTAHQLANEINKALGDGTVRLGSDPALTVSYLPTGVLPIDILLQGGLPRGRTTEIFGDYSTLKSYVGYRAIAETQGAGGTCALVDTEHAFDPEWAMALGVDTDSLIYQTPESGELAVDVTEVLVRQGVDLVVWDSVAATLPQAERNKRAHNENVQPARLAALMSQALRKLTAANSHTAMLFINQTRINVGQMFGSPESVPGGKAIPFYASYRLALRKSGALKRQSKQWDGEKLVSVKETYGQKIRATVEKSKLSKPYRDTYFTFSLDHAEVDEVGFLIAHGLEHGYVIREGNGWRIKGSKKKIIGAAKFHGWVAETPKARAKLMTMAYESVGLPNPHSSGGDAENEKA